MQTRAGIKITALRVDLLGRPATSVLELGKAFATFKRR